MVVPVARRVSFVLPAFNEQSNIATAVAHACAAGQRLCEEYEVIVVDDGSTDGTGAAVDRARQLDTKVRLVSHDGNKGYGQALRTGFSRTTLDLVFFTDADNQFDMRELALLLERIDDADVVAGYRQVRRDPAGRLWAARAWGVLVRSLLHVPVRDINCSFKLFRRDLLDGIVIESTGAMINAELMAKLAAAGAVVAEVAVTHRPRAAGRPTGANPRVVVRALCELVVVRWRMRHEATIEYARR